jgi:hypothetical protein
MTSPYRVLIAMGSAVTPHAQFFWAWILLCLALAVHVADEARTGFLSVYNPTVRVLRQRWPWLPFPVFNFGVWLAGLVVADAILLSMSFFALRGAAWMRPLGFIFAGIMLMNSLVHMVGTIRGRTVESVRFRRPMPGFYSSPFMLLASLYMLCVL